MPTGGDGTAYMGEKMDLKKADMGDVITDFRKSDAPQFKGKSDKKIQKMAIAAKLEADGKSLKDEYLPEILDKKDIPHVKKLVGKLRSGSKTHAKQADDLEKAMKENTAIESELVIQDWNKDDIKFTEIETVDIIKAKPLKENKFVDFVKNIGKSDVNKEIESLKDRLGPPPDSFKKELDKYDPSDDNRGIKDKNKKKKTKLHGVSVKSLKDFEKEAMRIRTEQKSNWRDEIDEGVGAALKVGGMIAPKIPGALKAIGAGAATGLGIVGTMMKSKKKETSDGEDEDAIFDKAQDIIKDRKAKAREYGEKPEVSQARERAEKKLKEFMAKRKKNREINNNKRKLMKDLDRKIVPDSFYKPPFKNENYDWREELGEDWQKVNRKDKTDGLSRKAVKAYRRENPGSKLQTAVTKDPKKLKKGSKSAKRRLSFCRRMKGMKKKLTSAKTRRDPDSRINKALRRWNC